MTRIDCTDRGGIIEIPEDVLTGEILSCPDCGLDYVVEEDGTGLLVIKELTIDGEDWGE